MSAPSPVANSLSIDLCGEFGQPTFGIELPVFALKKPSAVVQRRRWLQDEILSLASCYPTGEPVTDMAKRLGRSPAAVYGKARRMGLSRPQRGNFAPVVDEVPPEQIEITWPASAPALDLVQTTPANPPFLPPVEMPVPAPRQAKPFRLTALGGRQTVWTPDLVRRLVLLWVAGFHHTTIAEALDLTPCGVSSKAVRISLPYRAGVELSKDVAAARRTDAAGGTLPKVLTTSSGIQFIGKHCNLTGIWFYARRGTHTSVEAKLTLHYTRMQQSAF